MGMYRLQLINTKWFYFCSLFFPSHCLINKSNYCKRYIIPIMNRPSHRLTVPQYIHIILEHFPLLPKFLIFSKNEMKISPRSYLIFQDNDNFQFISGMKLKNKTLLITSSKLQNYILFQANGTDVKYRVMIIDNVDQLLDGSPCRKGQTGSTVHIPVTGGSTQRYYTTSHKPTTSHPIDNKHFSYKPPSDEVDNKQTTSFVQSHGDHGQPPYWNPGREQGLLQKQPSHGQIPHKTSQGSNDYSNSPTSGESKYHSTTNSYNQHWPQEPKTQKNPSIRESRDPTDDKESAREEKSPSESFESESQNNPSVFHKPTMIRVPHKSPFYGNPQFNNLDFN